MKLSKNAKILFGIGCINTVLNLYTGVFFNLYFWQLSEESIVSICLYHIIEAIAIAATFMIFKNVNRTTNRLWLFRIGCMMMFLYFLAILLLKDDLLTWYPLVAAFYGVAQGLWWPPFHIINSGAVPIEQRKRYAGLTSSVHAAINILFPILFGTSVAAAGFLESSLIVLALCAGFIILSFLAQDTDKQGSSSGSWNRFFSVVKTSPLMRNTYAISFLNGLTLSSGALSLMVSIFVMRSFPDSIGVGWLTSGAKAMAVLVGLLFLFGVIQGKRLKTVSLVATLLVSTSLLLLVGTKAVWAVIILQLVFGGYKAVFNSEIIEDIDHTSVNLIPELRDNFRAEHYAFKDLVLGVGRVAGHLLLMSTILIPETGILLFYIAILFGLYSLTQKFYKEVSL